MTQNKRPKILTYKPEGCAPIYFRRDSSDGVILQTVLIDQSEYNFPEVENAKVVFDVGANIGITSILMADTYQRARVFSFEPVAENLALAKRNVRPYKNVRLIDKALGSKTCKLKIFTSDDPTNHGGFSTKKAGVDLKQFQTISQLDAGQFCKRNRIKKIDVLKLDCEGAEYDVVTSLLKAKVEIEWIIGESHGHREFELFALLAKRYDLAVFKQLGSRIGKFSGRLLHT